MRPFPKRSKNEFELRGKNRPKPIGKPTFGGSSWRPMLASSWPQNFHFACFCSWASSVAIVSVSLRNCYIFLGFFNMFCIPKKRFSDVGGGFPNWAWMFKIHPLEERKTMKKLTFFAKSGSKYMFAAFQRQAHAILLILRGKHWKRRRLSALFHQSNQPKRHLARPKRRVSLFFFAALCWTG